MSESFFNFKSAPFVGVVFEHGDVVVFVEAVGDAGKVRKVMGNYFTKFVTGDSVEHILDVEGDESSGRKVAIGFRLGDKFVNT